jgi:hypothetical protein
MARTAAAVVGESTAMAAPMPMNTNAAMPAPIHLTTRGSFAMFMKLPSLLHARRSSSRHGRTVSTVEEGWSSQDDGSAAET